MTLISLGENISTMYMKPFAFIWGNKNVVL